MDIIESFRTAFSALLRNKVRSALTMLGIIIGVSSVILLISLGAGLQKSITAQFEKLGTGTLYVVPGKFGEGGGLAGGSGMSTNKFKFSDADRIKREINNISAVTPGIESITSVEYRGGKRKGVIFLAIDSSFFAIGDYNVKQGRFFTENENKNAKRVVIVGQTIVEKLMGGVNPLNKQISVRGKKYKIIGVLEKQGSIVGQDQDNMVILPAETANRQIGFDRPTWILVKASSNEIIPTVKKDIEKLLLNRLTDDDFTVLTQEESLNIAEQILGIVRVVFVGIAAISLVVGGIGISNIMFVSVTERTREIGLRKAVGAAPGDIFIQFLIEAVTLSFAGGAIGLLLASIGTLAARLFMPAVVTPFAVILAISFSVAVGIIFGVVPALRASKLEPIEALRYE
ncbi:hypothetical protein A3A48_03785 [Candidatus Curtissbacteria bacterium RIFCSPLOWO2_01_FULL_37_9]|uniref:Multidrug ABC transporter substrate-binding protein n=1 Tax=Candidatus Curtissbacteria bacterium RIFCSPLOWO2_01_FULL_37_9 TaxID=1797724 RepID=A0A1F5GVX9_9BACT|nr:MAG: hypothetical protein A3A48_03785 [Candidatus Curtissbacteria bacterium RIFCSPLOWO2_01_FULL_37_9]